MATVPYQNGVPTTNPALTPPDDYQHIQANPSSFGADIAKGTEDLGQGIVKAGDFFNKVQTDAATNNTMDSLNKVMEHFRSLRGQDALDAQKSTYDQGQQILDDNRKQLSTPGQQLEYDSITRNFYQRYFSGIIASHSDQQAKDFTTQTNDAKFKNALTGAANVADDDTHVEAFRNMAREAAVQEVLNQGNGRDPEIIKAAYARADMATYKTAAEAKAVSNPSGALDYINAHRDALGAEYAPLADQFRHRADEQVATSAALGTRGATSGGPRPASGSYNDAVYAHETGRGANMGNPAAAYGPYQFEPATWRSLQERHPELQLSDATGNPTTDGRRDMGQATRAYNVFTAENRTALQHAGIEPNDKNTFMAAFLGSGGATHFIQQMQANPSQGAASLFPKEASYNHDVFYDHGRQRTLQEVYNLQTQMFSSGQSPSGSAGVSRGTPDGETPIVNAQTVTPISTGTATPAAVGAPPSSLTGGEMTPAAMTMAPPSAVVESSESRLAARLQQIENNPNLSDPQKVIASQKVAQDEQRQQIMEMSTQKAQKDKAEERADYYGKQTLGGTASDKTFDELLRDPAFEHFPQLRQELGKAMLANVDEGIVGAAKHYGSGYWDAKNRILLPAGDPRRISDIADIYKEAGLRADGTQGTLTMAGADKLVSTMQTMRKSTETSAVQHALMRWMDYAKPKITFDGEQGDIPGVTKGDLEGRLTFDRFAADFELGLDKAVQGGEDPRKYLTQKNVDDMMVPYVRSATENRMKRLAAEPDQPEPSGTPIPTPPKGTNPIGWTQLMAQVPIKADGTPMSHDHWSHALQLLMFEKDNPSMIQQWNTSVFAQKGWKAEDVIGAMGSGTILPSTQQDGTVPGTAGQPAHQASPTPATAAGHPAFEQQQDKLVKDISDWYARQPHKFETTPNIKPYGGDNANAPDIGYAAIDLLKKLFTAPDAPPDLKAAIAKQLGHRVPGSIEDQK